MYGTQLFPCTQMDAIFVGLELMDKLRRNQKNQKFSGSFGHEFIKKEVSYLHEQYQK